MDTYVNSHTYMPFFTCTCTHTYIRVASIDDDWKNKAPYRAYANFKARMSDSVYVQDFESKQFENTQVIYESDDGTVSAVLDQGADQTVVHGRCGVLT